MLGTTPAAAMSENAVMRRCNPEGALPRKRLLFNELLMN